MSRAEVSRAEGDEPVAELSVTEETEVPVSEEVMAETRVPELSEE